MRLSPPKFSPFLVSAFLILLALLGQFAVLAFIKPLAVWLFIAAWVVLALSVLLKDL
jgi:small-conductance mechanosensitive channel